MSEPKKTSIGGILALLLAAALAAVHFGVVDVRLPESITRWVPSVIEPASKVGPVRVLLTYESSQGIPIAFMSPDNRSWLNSHSVKGADGRPAWRVWDKDTRIADSTEQADFGDLLLKPKASMPWIDVTNARGVIHSGPCPDGGKDSAALLQLLKTYGGE